MSIFKTFDPENGYPDLPGGQVQVWLVQLEQDEDTIARLRRMLSADERARADRFYFTHLRTHFTAARGALRILSGNLTGRDPADIKFVYAQHGKPGLPEGDLNFNVSHSGTLGLIALARGLQVGVDIEKVRDLPDGEAVARRYFSEEEVSDFLETPANERMTAFFNCWTRKEAFIKAIGDGLAYPLDAFRVSLRPGSTAELMAVFSEPEQVQNWQMVDIQPGAGYAGALIAEGKSWEVETCAFAFKPG